MIKISIIVPIYNIEDYLIKCLDSLINQKYQNIEIILVNDGSTDNSLSICKMYEKKDKRIKIVNQKNKGLSSARNIGLKYSTGEFVWFVDGDDYIDDNSIDILLKYLDDDTDIVVFNYYKVNGNILKNVLCDFNNFEINYIISSSCVWNKVFRRTILYDDMFPIGHIYEDLYVIPTLILKTKRIKFIDDYLYYYVYRKNSISNKNYNNIEEHKYVLKNVEELLIDKYYNEVEYLYIYHLLIPCLFKKNVKEIKEVNRYIKSIFPNYYRNRYLKNKKIIFFIIYKFL